MAEVTRERLGEIVRVVFKVLEHHQEGLPVREALGKAEAELTLSPWERSDYPNRPGIRRFDKLIRFATITAVKAGWMIKDGRRWILTEEGRRALHNFEEPEAFYRESIRLYKEWNVSRPGGKKAPKRKQPRSQDIGSSLRLIEQAETQISQGDTKGALEKAREAAQVLMTEIAPESDLEDIHGDDVRRFVSVVSALTRTLSRGSDQRDAKLTSGPADTPRERGRARDSPVVWVLRGGSNGELIPDFVSQELVGVGFGIQDSLAGLERDRISKIVEQAHPNKSRERRSAYTGLLNTFVNELREGDFAISPERQTGKLWFFRIEGPYEYRRDPPVANFHHVRKARFLDWHFRDVVSEASQRSLGGQQTVYFPKDQDPLLELARKSEELRRT